MTDPFMQQLFLSPWSGAPARGQLPQVPQRPALDTASEALVGCLVRIPGATGVADATYECKKGADDTYSWVQIDGGASTAPLGLLGYANTVGSQTGITSETAVTGLSVAFDLADTRYVRASLAIFIQNSSASVQTLARIKWASSSVAFSSISPGAGVGADYLWAWTFSLAAASYTFTATLAPNSGTVSASSGQLTVEDIGAA